MNDLKLDSTRQSNTTEMSEKAPIFITHEAVQALNHFDELVSPSDQSLLSNQSIVETIGVFAGIKTAALLRPDYFPENSSLKGESPLVEIFKSMNLFLLDKAKPGNDWRYVVLSQKQEDAYALYNTFCEDVNEEREYRLGELLGYPESATDYFLERMHVKEQTGQFPPQVRPLGRGAYTGFILSPDHMDQETFDYVIPLQQAMKTYLPRTYDRIESKEIDELCARFASEEGCED